MGKKYTYERVKTVIKNEGYKLLSTEYNGMHEKLKLECPVGHVYEVSLTNFIHNNHRCPHCYYKLVGDSRRYSYDYVKSKFEERGFVLLSKEYKDNKSKLEYICKRGHKTKITFSDLIQGKGCRKCANIEMSGENSVHWKGGITEVKDRIRRDGRYLGWQIISRKAYGGKCIITDKLKIESIEEINFSGHIISYETSTKEIASFEEIYKYV